MADQEELSMEEILASIRNILWEKEVNKSASRSCIRDYAKEAEGDVFELSKDMLVKGWALPYEYSQWTFDDVAAKILHKYAAFFARDEAEQRQKAELEDNFNNPSFANNRADEPFQEKLRSADTISKAAFSQACREHSRASQKENARISARVIEKDGS